MGSTAGLQKEHLLVCSQDILVCGRVCALTSSYGFLSLLLSPQPMLVSPSLVLDTVGALSQLLL